jgi:hypothetical protein
MHLAVLLGQTTVPETSGIILAAEAADAEVVRGEMRAEINQEF